jgi:hypothetical protein
MGAAEIERFLTYLAVEGKVAASTQNQALCHFVFPTKHKLTEKINKKRNSGKKVQLIGTKKETAIRSWLPMSRPLLITIC